ncbi:30S ribosomal protein S3 [Candidatus Nomurabacteria bacterium RIFCSPLOWO2_02_FULL_42_17]|uniref:Small ribosomal subunit protein uS3 n=2 Tax=Candidatus Nomuraibacteriota TaxID=1752729 RepID=A0A1F6WGV2_9BACT|nr:MAG: 30S ribosomal protein S3 [Parcubacteria group bacterium GW2011_GWA2_42_18]OGI81147.1 MAG: 30S ribosomal protein S3 [Candidatus Nomurabacteria bacterium RIFCSPHIGHO2_02_FULL_42_24]OGI97221.1 MAG: 30S ribosomal protein S3 [Candidatus Nomurabacteria bacterium RIFCSPLOWO2_02_FULL_42_17]
MSKVVHPYAHRLTILRDWKSRWFAAPARYKEYLKGDITMREYLEKKLRGGYISSIEIERSSKSLRVLIHTSRPGVLIGRSGEAAVRLREDILRFMKARRLLATEEFKLDVMEVPSPDADARIAAYSIVEGLEKRLPYRRVIKQAVEKIINTRGILGARIRLSGRLGGAEIARREDIRRGSIPLQTFRADVDFARERAHLPYGDIGIKVWIYKGIVFDKKSENKD